MTMHTRRPQAELISIFPRNSTLPPSRILVVTEPALAASDGAYSLDKGTLISYCDLTPQELLQFAPGTVISPLVSSNFDCTDVAKCLEMAAFSGEFRILCGPLPRPELVTDELRRSFPTLDIELWALPPI